MCAAFALFKNLFVCLFVCSFHFLATVSFSSSPSPFHHALFPLPSLSQGSPAAAGDHTQHLSSMLVTRKRGFTGQDGNGQKREIQLNKSQGARCSGQQ